MSCRPRLKVVLALVLAMAMLASACGTSEVVVTEGAVADLMPAAVDTTPSAAALLGEASARAGQGTYRFEVFGSVALGDGSFKFEFVAEQPVSTGEVSPTRQYTFTDVGPVFDEMFSQLDDPVWVQQTFGSDFTVESVVDGRTLYLRAPVLSTMAAGPAGVELPPGLAELGDGWGLIQLGPVAAFDAADMAGPTAGYWISPDEVASFLEAGGADVEDLGSATVRGVETRHLRAYVNVGVMLAAHGIGEDLLGDTDFAALDWTLPFDVFIDSEARVRRVIVGFSMDGLAALSGEEITGGAQFETSTTIEWFDFGAELSIDVPADADIVGDFTDVFADWAVS